MRRLIPLMALVAALVVASATAWAQPPTSKNFNAHLTGDEEVPTPRDTQAQGQAKFRDAGESISYKLSVANIENVFAAHIHCGAEGENGPIGVTLFGPVAPGGGRVQGLLAQGEITEPDPGSECDWETLDDVIEAMLSGDAYVNVHTNDGVGEANTGPGDFQSGEIRGQITETGAS